MVTKVAGRVALAILLLALAFGAWAEGPVMPGTPLRPAEDAPVMPGTPLRPAEDAPVMPGTPLRPAEASASPTPTHSPSPTPDVTPTPSPMPSLRVARIRAVGDLMVHQKQLNYALQPDGAYDFHPQYALIADALADADYTLANLETTVGRCRDMAYSGYPMFNSPESLLETVRDAGVDFLTLANNHIMDRYDEGVVSTVENVAAYGFDHGGANRSPEEQARPVIVEAGGIRIGVLCYTEMTNGMERYCKRVRDYGVNYLRDADLDRDAQRLRDAGAEVVIAMPHWGAEYQRKPEARVVALAERMVAAGVDVVLGSHPHMVQPVAFVEAETPDGSVRTGLVAYSLGNFVSNMSKRYTDSGIILEFTLSERATGGFTVGDVRFVPTFCWRQDGAIRTLSALKYYDAPPEGMDRSVYARMKDSCDDLRALIDAQIPMIAE